MPDYGPYEPKHIPFIYDIIKKLLCLKVICGNLSILIINTNLSLCLLS